ncbi:hypothetical protein DOT_1306 [Desulfosporosinus sp. OT]|nr:hypothetical protein DOT_1306 [Desulfosporosinus sp. OT]
MGAQKEKVTSQEVTKCRVCGNENIKENHNFCTKCGNQLKKNPIIIDFRA